MRDANTLADTLERISQVTGHEIPSLPEILNVEDLAKRSGVPADVVAALLSGREVPEPDLAARVRQRLEFVRQTQRRPDGKRYSLGELAGIAGTSRQWLSEWRTKGMPSMEHAERLRSHFSLPAGFFTATAPEALNGALQKELRELETAADPKARLRDAGLLQIAERAADMDPQQRATLLKFAEWILTEDRKENTEG
ncbi:XRE family transcriptional regulator [Streptomyces sp. NPDC002845]